MMGQAGQEDYAGSEQTGRTTQERTCWNNQNNSGTGRNTQDQTGEAGTGGTRNMST